MDGDDLNHRDVTRALGVFPDRAWRRGEQLEVPMPDGRRVKYDVVRTNGGWMKFHPPELKDASVEDQLAYWIAFLSPKATSIQELLARELAVKLDCFIASNETERVTLDPSLLASLAALGVEVEIIFSPGA